MRLRAIVSGADEDGAREGESRSDDRPLDREFASGDRYRGDGGGEQRATDSGCRQSGRAAREGPWTESVLRLKFCWNSSGGVENARIAEAPLDQPDTMNARGAGGSVRCARRPTDLSTGRSKAGISCGSTLDSMLWYSAAGFMAKDSGNSESLVCRAFEVLGSEPYANTQALGNRERLVNGKGGGSVNLHLRFEIGGFPQ